MTGELERRVGMAEIDKRLAVVEQYIRAREEYERDDRKWLRTLSIAFIIQVIALVGAGGIAAVEVGRMIQRLESIDVVQLRNQTATALQVLADHGTEIELVRQEQFRLRGNIDAMRNEMLDRTKNRFDTRDADKMEERFRLIVDSHDHNDYSFKNQ